MKDRVFTLKRLTPECAVSAKKEQATKASHHF